MWDYLFVMKVNVADIKMNLKSRTVVIFVLFAKVEIPICRVLSVNQVVC